MAPRQLVPASSVINTKTSTPLLVKLGAVPAGHLVAAGQYCVYAPPLVNSKIILPALEATPLELVGGLVKDHVTAPTAVADT
jgi:hypothetical protein